MEKEIIIDGFKYTLRSDGVYETQDLALYDSELSWGAADEHANMYGIIIPYNGKVLVKYIAIGTNNDDDIRKIINELIREYPKVRACEAIGVPSNFIGGL